MEEVEIDVSCNNEYMKVMESCINQLKTKFESLPLHEKEKFNHENGGLIQNMREAQHQLNKRHSELEKKVKEIRDEEERKANEILCAKEQHLTGLLSRIRRLNVIAADHRRRMEPVKYFADLLSQLEVMYPKCKVSFISTTSTPPNVIGSQEEYVFALEDQIESVENESGKTDLELNVNFETRKRCRDDTTGDENEEEKQMNRGVWTKAEKMAYATAIRTCGEGKWAKIAQAIGTRDRTQVKVFARSKFAKRFKLSPTPFQVYSTAIEALSTAVEGVRENDENASENESESHDDDDIVGHCNESM